MTDAAWRCAGALARRTPESVPQADGQRDDSPASDRCAAPGSSNALWAAAIALRRGDVQRPARTPTRSGGTLGADARARSPDVEQVRRRPWEPFTSPRLLVDNVGDPAEHVAAVLSWLATGQIWPTASRQRDRPSANGQPDELAAYGDPVPGRPLTLARLLAAGRSPQPICSASMTMMPSGPRT
jgi:hypothetical protein